MDPIWLKDSEWSQPPDQKGKQGQSLEAFVATVVLSVLILFTGPFYIWFSDVKKSVLSLNVTYDCKCIILQNGLPF